jgi:hypothetical protein
MEALSSGNFFGNTDQTIQLDGLVVTNTEYTHEFVDWHFHEMLISLCISAKVVLPHFWW